MRKMVKHHDVLLVQKDELALAGSLVKKRENTRVELFNTDVLRRDTQNSWAL